MLRSTILTRRRGSMLAWGVVVQGLLLGIAALVVDAAMARTSHAELQSAADSAALAGASAIALGPEKVRQRATTFASRNAVAGQPLELRPEDVQLGEWDPETRTFADLPPDHEDEANAVRVTALRASSRGNPLELAFARMFGSSELDLGARATAVYRPRDIMLVLDLSGSMNDDSEIRHVDRLGRDAIEDNIRKIWEDLGSPEYGNLEFEPQYISSNDDYAIYRYLDLDDTPYPYDASYPYPEGSWHDYIDYVQNDDTLAYYGYRKRYGMLTLINYWQHQLPYNPSTPDLWMTRQQPITAVKNAVDVFLNHLQEEDTDDRVGLSTYSSLHLGGVLESQLTDNHEHIRTITHRRQAAHYNGPTNIGDGMRHAREELNARGRKGALKMVVLLTDGKANRPQPEYAARELVRDEADQASSRDYPIMTISLGADADENLMQEVADMTEGIHFNIPGGQSVDQYAAELRSVFKRIAADRPLKLVN